MPEVWDYLTKVACAAIAVAVLASCGGPTGTRSPGAQPAASSSFASAPTCKLPVASIGGDQSYQAGFIALPSGTFMPDASASMDYDPATLRTRTTQVPQLFGDGSGITYDAAFHRWLPVTPAQVLPDGSAYAYTREASPTQARNEVHLVDVASGTDRVITNQDAYHVITYTPEGIYVDYHLNGTDASSGLWLMNPTSGALNAYPAGRQATWARIAAGGAWSYSPEGYRFGSPTFARLDLATGSVTTWFSVPSSGEPGGPGWKSVRVLGFDGSQPLVQVYIDEHHSQVWRLTAPGQATRLPDLPLGVFSPPLSVADAHGTWLIADSVYLYAGSGFHRVASAPAGGSGKYAVAGGCS